MICWKYHIIAPLLLFDIQAPETYEMFVYKQVETIEYVKK